MRDLARRDQELLVRDNEKLAKKLDGLKVPLIRAASESGHLYGSVTSRDIAVEVATESKEAVTRAMIDINQNFKTIGLFPVDVVLHPEVRVSVTVNIARSSEEAGIQAKTGKALVADAVEEEEAAPVAETTTEQLEGVLEESALEAEKEKVEAAAEDVVEAEAKTAEEDAESKE